MENVAKHFLMVVYVYVKHLYLFKIDMPLYKKWSAFNKENVLAETDAYGVYELGDRNGEIVYIGQGRISSRLNSHFLSGRHPIPRTSLYRVEIIGSKKRAEQRERAEIRAYMRTHGTCPSYNDRLG